MAYLGFAEQEVGTIQRRKRNNLLQRAVSSPKNGSRQHRSAAAAWARPKCRRLDRGAPRRTASPALRSRSSPFIAPIYANLFDDEGGKRSSLGPSGRKNWLGRALHHPTRFERAGLGQNDQARP